MKNRDVIATIAHGELTPRRSPSLRAGLTLLELVVVLLILSVLTIVAVQSTANLADQARYEVTQRTLDHLHSAVLGDPPQTEATMAFIADMGRAPVAAGADPATQLAELWTPPANPAFLFNPRTAAGDTDVVLLAGWRGPYVRLGAQTGGPQRLLDGWGKPFDLLNASATLAKPGEAIIAARSNGGSEAPYNTATTTSVPWTPSIGTINGSVQDTDPTNTAATKDVTVKLFHPDLTQPSGVKELTATATKDAYTFSFSNVPAGAIALRAYQDTRKSSVIHLRLPPGGATRTIYLDIQ